MSAACRDLKTLSVLIVGCGNIAGGFDLGRSSNDFPYTHAGAYRRDGRFIIVACVEPDEAKRADYMSAWNVSAGFSSINEVLHSGLQFDVISICSPTFCHAHDLEIALCLKPQLIFCEKPVTASVEKTESLVQACYKNKVLLAVNYSRRFDPDVLKLQARMLGGEWGVLRSVVGIYNKGILNNGSHMLDLLNFLLGKMEIVKTGEPVYDFFENDPTIPVWLKDENGVPVYLACAHASDYAIFELQLIFSHGVLTMEEGGFFWRERLAQDSSMFKGYRMLDEGVRRVGEYPFTMLRAVDNIYRALRQGDVLASTGDTALEAQVICKKISQQAEQVLLNQIREN